jgi:type IV pilus assembly protein PilQ
MTLWIAAGLFLPGPGLSAAAVKNEITGLRVLRMEDAMVLEISKVGEVKCKAFPLGDPERLVIDCLGARLRLGWQVREMEDPLVHRIRGAQYRIDPRPISRLVLDLKQEVVYRMWEEDEVQVVEIKNGVLPPEPLAESPPEAGFSLRSVPDGADGLGIFSRKIMLEAQGTDIKTVLKAISASSGKNIISGPEIKGAVYVRLRDLGWEEVLNIILRTHGYEYREASGMIFVSEKISAIPEEPEILPAVGKVDAAPSPGAPLEASPERDLSARTRAPRGEEAPMEKREEPAKIPDPAEYRIDIKARLLQADVEAVRELGIDWVPSDRHRAGKDEKGSGAAGDGVFQPAETLSSGTAGSAEVLRRQLEKLTRTNAATLLSVSRTTTTNNGEVQILVGRKITVLDPEEAGTPIAKAAKTSITLLVNPQANRDGTVTLNLHLEVVVIRPEGTEPGGVSITSGSADARITVGDGEIAVVSGLRNFIGTGGGGKGPAFGEEPAVKKDFILLVTPTIVK